MNPHRATPTTTARARVGLPNAHDSTYLCHGCNIMLKDTTRHFKKIEYLGPGQCAGCEFNTEDGYLVRPRDPEYIHRHRILTNRQLKEEAEPALKKHMEFIKSEMVWEISQELAADRQRRRDQRIAEARAAAPTNKPGGQEGRQEERRQEEDRQSAAVGRYPRPFPS